MSKNLQYCTIAISFFKLTFQKLHHVRCNENNNLLKYNQINFKSIHTSDQSLSFHHRNQVRQHDQNLQYEHRCL